MDDGALGDWDVDEGLDRVVLDGRLRGGARCWKEGGLGYGGLGVMVWVRVSVRVVSLGLPLSLLWCWGLRGVLLVVVLLLAAALALAVALWIRSAGRGGSEDEVDDFDEDEDEEEVVVLEDAGSAVMRAVAGLWAAASPAARAGRSEGMSSSCRLGVGGWGGPPVTWRPGGPVWSAAVGGGGAGLRSSPSGFG